MRRATLDFQLFEVAEFISIHALREESDKPHGHEQFHLLISIHALREESDLRLAKSEQYKSISIHALREESDSPSNAVNSASSDFNPRSP